MAIQGPLYQQFFPVAFQRPDSFVHVCRECSCRAAIHHFRHGQNVLVIGFDDLPITARDRDPATCGFSALCNFVGRVPVLIQLLGNLSEQFVELAASRDNLLHFHGLEAIDQRVGCVFDGANPDAQDL